MNQIPIFPLDGVIILPGSFLPLNVFEKRYLNMVEDSFPDDLQTQNYIFTQLFNHIQARNLYQELTNKPTKLKTF